MILVSGFLCEGCVEVSTRCPRHVHRVSTGCLRNQLYILVGLKVVVEELVKLLNKSFVNMLTDSSSIVRRGIETIECKLVVCSRRSGQVCEIGGMLSVCLYS